MLASPVKGTSRDSACRDRMRSALETDTSVGQSANRLPMSITSASGLRTNGGRGNGWAPYVAPAGSALGCDRPKTCSIPPTERRWNRTIQPEGCSGLPVLKSILSSRVEVGFAGVSQRRPRLGDGLGDGATFREARTSSRAEQTDRRDACARAKAQWRVGLERRSAPSALPWARRDDGHWPSRPTPTAIPTRTAARARPGPPSASHTRAPWR